MRWLCCSILIIGLGVGCVPLRPREQIVQNPQPAPATHPVTDPNNPYGGVRVDPSKSQTLDVVQSGNFDVKPSVFQAEKVENNPYLQVTQRTTTAPKKAPLPVMPTVSAPGPTLVLPGANPNEQIIIVEGPDLAKEPKEPQTPLVKKAVGRGDAIMKAWPEQKKHEIGHRPDPVVLVGHQKPLDPASASREPVVEALQCILENRHHDALDLLKRYDPATQELFMRLLPAMGMLTRKTVEKLGPDEVAALDEQIRSLQTNLKPRTKLTIATACFCGWVKGFGDYQPLADDHTFHPAAGAKPGERVQLYVELRNFLNQSRDGVFETRLSTSLEIQDQSGKSQWRHSFDDLNHPLRSRTPLHDHHNAYTFYVPSSLEPGDYRLILRIEDHTQGSDIRVDARTLAFRVR